MKLTLCIPGLNIAANMGELLKPCGLDLAFEVTGQLGRGEEIVSRTDPANGVGEVLVIDSDSHKVKRGLLIVTREVVLESGEVTYMWFSVNPESGEIDNPRNYKIRPLSVERFMVLVNFAKGNYIRTIPVHEKPKKLKAEKRSKPGERAKPSRR